MSMVATMNMPVDISHILSQLEVKIKSLAKLTISYYVNEGCEDGKKLLAAMQDGLERWVQALADQKITTRDFETLVMGDMDLVDMDGLSYAGLALARVEKFKGSVFNLIIDTVFNILEI